MVLAERQKVVYEFGSFRLDPTRRLLLKDGQQIQLTPKAFDTLLILVESRGKTVDKDYLMDQVWPGTFVEEGSLTRNISALRKALGENARENRYIVTRPGEGYAFVAEVNEVTELELPEPAQEPAQQSGPEASPTLKESVETPLTIRLNSRALLTLAVILVASIVFISYAVYSLRRANTIQRLEAAALTHTGNIVVSAISPDGKYIAYAVADSPTTRSLWIRQLATQTSTQIAPPAVWDYTSITFSLDNNYLYYTGRPYLEKPALYRRPLLGGSFEKILDDIDSRISFAPDGRRFVFRRRLHQAFTLVVADIDGGHQQEIARIESPNDFGAPCWSPDGRKITAIAGNADGGWNRYAVETTPEGGALRQFSQKRWRVASDMEWLADGSGLLLAASDDPQQVPQIWRLDYSSGTAERLTSSPLGFVRLSYSRGSGKVLAIQNRRVSNVWLIHTDNPSQPEQITFGSGGYRGDLCWVGNEQIAYESAIAGAMDLSVMNSNGSNQRRLLPDSLSASTAVSPVATPDSRYILFACDKAGQRNIWRIQSDGSNPLQLTHGQGEDGPHPTPDGKWVLFNDISTATQTIWRVSIDGGPPTQLTKRFSREGVVSPDGRWIACFYDNGDRQLRLAVLPAEGGEPVRVFPQQLRHHISVRWTVDSSKLLYADYVDGASNIWSQALEGGAPEKLTQFKREMIFGFDLSRDGKRLICVRGIWEHNLILLTRTEEAQKP